MKTYWKNLRVRIEPIEKLRALVLVSIQGNCTCSKFIIREPIDCNCETGTLDLEVAMMHHLSFVRTTTQLENKISKFEHSNEIISNWVNDIWKQYDIGDNCHTMKNLHPTEPEAYQTTVSVPAINMPPALRKLYFESCIIPKYEILLNPSRLKMLCHSQFDKLKYLNQIIKRSTPLSLFHYSIEINYKKSLDFLILVVSGVIDVSTKLVFREIAYAIKDGRPGFSNQPSFWNLNRIRNKKLYFNVDDALFEQVFSLQYYQRGLRVACLEHETTFHIGDDVSAYKLNNEDSRYWDATD